MITVTNASVKYDNRFVFTDLGFTLPKGKIGAILGSNGRGKTSLLKAIVGLQKLTGGSIQTTGRIGYVAQKTEITFSYRVLDIVVMGRATHVKMFRVPSVEDYEIARKTLTDLRLDHLIDQPYSRLSGGERQLVMIARALASECRILVLDEPTSALDLANQLVIFQALQKVAKKSGLTVLMTTHAPQQVSLMCDYVLLMYNTEESEWGEVDSTLNAENLERLYGIPMREVKVSSTEKTFVPLISTTET